MASMNRRPNLREDDDMNGKSTVALVLGTFFVFAAASSRVAYGAPPTDACTLLTLAR